MARGMALCVGVTEADAGTYGNRLPAAGAATSAEAMHRLAQSRGFESTLLTGTCGPSHTPRLQTFAGHVREAARALNGIGGAFLLAFSGHGALKRRDEREQHGWDEAWCLQDGPLLDDDLYDLLTEFDSSVQIWVISDSCHSGTMVDREAAPAGPARPRGDPAAPKLVVYERPTPVAVSRIRPMLWAKRGRRRGEGDALRAPVLCLSACQDSQTIACAPSLSSLGIFEAPTSFLNKVERIWRDGEGGLKPYPGTCNQFCHQVVLQATRPGQNPNKYWLNEALNFGDQRPAFPQFLSEQKPYTRAPLSPLVSPTRATPRRACFALPTTQDGDHEARPRARRGGFHGTTDDATDRG